MDSEGNNTHRNLTEPGAQITCSFQKTYTWSFSSPFYFQWQTGKEFWPWPRVFWTIFDLSCFFVLIETRLFWWKLIQKTDKTVLWANIDSLKSNGLFRELKDGREWCDLNTMFKVKMCKKGRKRHTQACCACARECAQTHTYFHIVAGHWKWLIQSILWSRLLYIWSGLCIITVDKSYDSFVFGVF